MAVGFGQSVVLQKGCLRRFGWFWATFWVVAVGLRRHAVSLAGGLTGFERFWTSFWVVSVGSGRHAVSLAGGPSAEKLEILYLCCSSSGENLEILMNSAFVLLIT